MKYSFKCTCGQIMTVDGNNREEALQNAKDMMTEEAVKSHMEEKHPGQPVPSQDQVYAMIEETLVEGDMNEGQTMNA